MRHVQRELVRVEHLVKEGRAFLKSWANDPEAPGALPGTAATQNTLDGIDWAHLAAEEGGVANLEEALKTAADAAQRSNKFMMELVEWLNQKFTASATEGSPSPKRPRRELASGSAQFPRFREAETARERDRDPDAHREPELRPRGELPGGHAHVLRARVPPLLPGQHQGLPPLPNSRGEGGDATPYQILRAQQILEGALPFLEQEVAATIAEAHSLLFSWTTALWGSPIVMVNQTGVGMSPDSAAETVPWHVPGEDAGGTYPDTVDTADEERTWSQTSHRRRRMHAAMADDPEPSE